MLVVQQEWFAKDPEQILEKSRTTTSWWGGSMQKRIPPHLKEREEHVNSYIDQLELLMYNKSTMKGV
jgi:hypothetical protein